MGYGILCRVLLYTNFIFGALNTAVVELTTPSFVDPNGLLLCLTTPQAHLGPYSFTIGSIKEGGDQFKQAENEMLVANTAAANMPFFQGSVAQWRLRSVEFGTLRDVLATDPFFAHTYRTSRYDDFLVDLNGASLAGLLAEDAPSYKVPGDDFADVYDSTEDGRHNCALITGAWQRATRYQVTLTFRNPPGNASTELGLWMAPMSYAYADQKHLLFRVRGHKYGQMCMPHKSVTKVLQPPPAGNSAALFSLTTSEDSSAGSNADETRTLPVALLADSAQPPQPIIGDSACPAGSALSLRFGGECIDCSGGSASSDGGACTCPATLQRFRNTKSPNESLQIDSRLRCRDLLSRLSCSATVAPVLLIEMHCRLVAGPAACGEEWSAGGATSAAELAAELCTLFTGEREQLMAGLLSDEIVGREYVNVFLEKAQPLLDRSSLYQANQTLERQYLRDKRRPSSPTRSTGLLPNCIGCSQGLVTDFSTGKQTELVDRRYRSVQVFNLLGLLLHEAGYTCSSLFRPENPLGYSYGPYSDGICVS